jgi:hypothetical protein
MVGCNAVVYQKLKVDVPTLILIPCVCHSIQLAVSSAAEQHLPRSVDFIVKSTFNWFSKLSGRQSGYEELYRAINMNHKPKKIVRACHTRWLSIDTAVDRIVTQCLELKTHFAIARTRDHCLIAEILHGAYEDDTNYAYLVFLRYILRDLQRVNKMFESNSTNHMKLLDELVILISGLVKIICVPRSGADPLTMSISQNLLCKPYLGLDLESFVAESVKHQRIGPSAEKILRERCIDFLTKLIHELRNRLPANINLIRKISTLSQ